MAGAASAHQPAAASREGNGQQRARRTRRTSADPQRAQQGATAAAAAAPAALDSLSRLQQLADASPQVAQLRRLQALADSRFAPVAQREGGPEEEELGLGTFATAQRQPQLQQAPRANNTGLPDQLKSGIESLSGLSMDHVRVHYNSAQPTQLNALAYSQGSDIHLAPGQERHLPHEAWHVVQQAQGRVGPTMQAKGMAINDDQGLETEADLMGARAVQMVDGGQKPRPDLVAPLQHSETTQLRKQNKIITGITHVVSEDNGSLYKEKWWTNEHEELHEGDKIVVETDDQIISRRGPNQEQKGINEIDKVSPQYYLWYRLLEIKGNQPEAEKSYIREDTFTAPKDKFQNVELWDGLIAESSPHSINAWLRYLGFSVEPRHLYPFLAQSGGVYGTTKTDAERLIGDLRQYWASTHSVQFQAYYNDDESKPGHLLMYDCSADKMYQFKSRKKDQYPEKVTIRERIDKYMTEESSDEKGLGKMPSNVKYLDSMNNNAEKNAMSQRLELRRSTKKVSESEEWNRKDAKHTRCMSVEVELSKREYDKLMYFFAFREVLGFYSYCNEASMIDPGATRCLSILEDVAAMRNILLGPGSAKKVLQEFVDSMQMKDKVSTIEKPS
jgi:hypothetical protein